MKRVGVTLFLCAMLMLVIFSVQVVGALNVDEQTVNIVNTEEGLFVTEDFTLTNIGIENITELQLWIQQEGEDIEIIATEKNAQLTPIISGNLYTCNLSAYNLSINPAVSMDFQVTYTLTADRFEQTLIYDTTLLTVTLNQQELYRGQQLSDDESIRVLLYKPTEAPLNTLYLVIVFVLVILLIALTLLSLRKQRTKVRKEITDSEELLSTKKAVLLSALKDIEKQYRAKSISDETYNKLKDEYKQQAVEVMKKLEDMK